MRLDALEVRAVELPLRRPWRWARGELASRRVLVLEARAGARVGLGEAGPLPDAGTESFEACVAALEGASRGLRGAALSTLEDLDRLLAQRATGLAAAPCARFAVETALLDLLAQERGVPLARLLAPDARAVVAVNAVVDAGNVRADAARWLALGVRTFKLKVPFDLEHAVEVLADLRSAVGPACALRLDANGQWDLPGAVRALRRLAPFSVQYCEDPLPAPDDAPALRAACAVPVAADAWLSTGRGVARVLDGKGADVLVLKPAVLGGLRPALGLARRGLARGLRVVVTTALEGAIGRLAALHLAAAVPSDLAAGLATGGLLARDHDVAFPRLAGGALAVPAAAGLGASVGPAVPVRSLGLWEEAWP